MGLRPKPRPRRRGLAGDGFNIPSPLSKAWQGVALRSRRQGPANACRPHPFGARQGCAPHAASGRLLDPFRYPLQEPIIAIA
jgi:hypothetical protein